MGRDSTLLGKERRRADERGKRGGTDLAFCILRGQFVQTGPAQAQSSSWPAAQLQLVLSLSTPPLHTPDTPAGACRSARLLRRRTDCQVGSPGLRWLGR